MAILIKGAEMPTTGLYFVSIDNTNGRDKTIITVERMLGNRDIRQIVGSFELTYIPDDAKLGDLNKLENNLRLMAKYQDGDRQQGILGCCETIRLTKSIN